MSFNAYPLEDMEANVVWLSFWVNNSPENMNRNAEALTWHRVSKVAEESGEVISEMINLVDGNPRKIGQGDLARLKKELLDVVVAALGAYEHVDHHRGRSLHDLKDFIQSRVERAKAVGS